MQHFADINEVNEYVREYLRWSGMLNTLESFEVDAKSKQSQRLNQRGGISAAKMEDMPRLCQLLKPNNQKTLREINLEKDLKQQAKK